MARPVRWAFLTSLVSTCLVFAESKIEREPPKPPHVEVRFADGSVVRMTLLQESIEVATRYGRLTVPIHEIRRVELGMHMPEGVYQKIEDAVKRLGSQTFKEREDASQELIAFGAYAYPAVHTALKCKDPEVAQRAAEVVKRLREKVPPDLLRLNAHDKIQTAEFPITGRLVSPTLKARNAYFGDFQLRLSELRSIRWTTTGSEVEVNVEAGKHGSPNSPWLDTGIDVDAEVGLLISATGSVDLWPATPGQYTTGPTGYRNAGIAQNSSYTGGTLLGRIGENGKVFVVGERYEGAPNQEGRLFLAIAPSPWNNASAGSYQVRISGRHAAAR